MAEEGRTCKLCGETVEADKGRVHGQHFRCTQCTSAERMIRRNVGSGPELHKWAEEDARAFFQKIKLQKKEGSNLTWTTVRAVLVTKSVLLVRGWEEATLANFETAWSDAYKCDAYKVPTQRLTWRDVHEFAEEQVLEHERTCAQKRGKGAVEVDVPRAQGGKEPKGGSAHAQLKKVRTGNAKLAAMAAKAMGPLTQAGNGLARVMAQVAKAQVGEPADLALGEETAKQLEFWRKACSSVVQAEDLNKDKPEDAAVAPLSLPFGMADWKDLVKKAAAARQALHAALPKREPKATPPADPAATAREEAPKRRKTKKSA